jgi:NADH-quinone oxidoreductase subunit E
VGPAPGAQPGGGALGLVGATATGGRAASGDAPVAGASEPGGSKPEALSGPQGSGADDLKKIKGVGPKLERTLNGLGIYHFWQIAEFTRENVAWVDQHLRFRGRIDREQWIDQAKTLAAGGETEFSRRR